MDKTPYRLQSLHIDAARNATDDFNLFHDKSHWRRILDNPFGGPIALGFQLEMLIEEHVRRFREQAGEDRLLDEQGLNYSNYQFSFASVARVDDTLEVEIKPSRRDERAATLGNRVVLRRPGAIVLTGYKKESRRPLFGPDACGLPPLGRAADRSELGDSGYFLKRKYLTTANAKNFLLGSMVEQSLYIDELRDKVRFPELYPAAMLSCALLERALKDGHDFEREPMVYTSHQISIDRRLSRRLASNDALHILVARCRPVGGRTDADADTDTGSGRHRYDCLGIIGDDRHLYSAQIAMAPLSEIVGRPRKSR